VQSRGKFTTDGRFSKFVVSLVVGSAISDKIFALKS